MDEVTACEVEICRALTKFLGVIVTPEVRAAVAGVIVQAVRSCGVRTPELCRMVEGLEKGQWSCVVGSTGDVLVLGCWSCGGEVPSEPPGEQEGHYRTCELAAVLVAHGRTVIYQ